MSSHRTRNEATESEIKGNTEFRSEAALSIVEVSPLRCHMSSRLACVVLHALI